RRVSAHFLFENAVPDHREDKPRLPLPSPREGVDEHERLLHRQESTDPQRAYTVTRILRRARDFEDIGAIAVTKDFDAARITNPYLAHDRVSQKVTHGEHKIRPIERAFSLATLRRGLRQRREGASMLGDDQGDAEPPRHMHAGVTVEKSSMRM